MVLDLPKTTMGGDKTAAELHGSDNADNIKHDVDRALHLARMAQSILEPEPVLTEVWGELIGDPQFDPEKGIYAKILVGNVETKVLIQPKWWKYFLLPT